VDKNPYVYNCTWYSSIAEFDYLDIELYFAR
jgi:hypothetical protein